MRNRRPTNFIFCGSVIGDGIERHLELFFAPHRVKLVVGKLSARMDSLVYTPLKSHILHLPKYRRECIAELSCEEIGIFFWGESSPDFLGKKHFRENRGGFCETERGRIYRVLLNLREISMNCMSEFVGESRNIQKFSGVIEEYKARLSFVVACKGSTTLSFFRESIDSTILKHL